jgi:hypothetical protein
LTSAYYKCPCHLLARERIRYSTIEKPLNTVGGTSAPGELLFEFVVSGISLLLRMGGVIEWSPVVEGEAGAID